MQKINKMKSILSLIFALYICISYSFAQIAAPVWTELGPINFPTDISGQINGIGRTVQMKFHATDNQVVYAVTASGGAYRSNNLGLYWNLLSGTDRLPNTNLASICIDRSNDQNIWLGTGDPNYYYNGMGVWKSTDGGNNFFQSNTGMGNRLVVEILQDQTDASILIAATNAGIYKSTDGGTNWVLKTASTLRFTDMHYKVNTNSRTLFACTRDEFYLSNDNGENWSLISSGLYIPGGASGGLGCRVALTPADSNLVYLGMVANKGTIFKSVNGGYNFTAVKDSVSPNLTGYSNDPASNGQGNYNFDIAADPLDKDVLFLVAHNVWRSDDGGISWTQLTNWWQTVHTDMHDVVYSPFYPNVQLNANDGGIWKTENNGDDWQQLNEGLTATEVARANGSQLTNKYISIGTQDNGELYYNGMDWITNRGGDWYNSMYYDFANPSTVYYESSRKRDVLAGGQKSLNLPSDTKINDISFSRAEPRIGFVAVKDSLFRCDDIMHKPMQWNLIQTFSDKKIVDLHISNKNANLLLLVDEDNNIIYSTNALSSSPIFLSASSPVTPLSSNGKIVICADNDSSWACYFGSRVYKSYDFGATWNNISYDLPSVNLKSIVYDDFSSDQSLFVASNSYVYYLNDTMTAWQNYSTNLPSITDITGLFAFNNGTSDSRLRVSYYGRGVWETPINTINKKPGIDFSADTLTLCAGGNIQFHSEIENADSAPQWFFEGGSPENSSDMNPMVTYNTAGLYDISLSASNAFGESRITYPAYVRVLTSCQGDSIPGRALHCVSPGDYVKVKMQEPYLSEYSVTAWIKPDSIQDHFAGIVVNTVPTISLNFKDDNEIGYHCPGGSWSFSSGLYVEPDEWSYVALTIFQDSVVLYLNGKRAVHVTNIDDSLSLEDMRIGSYKGWSERNFRGLIDEVCFWNRALSQNEVRELRHLTKEDLLDSASPKYDNSIIGYFQFNDSLDVIPDKKTGTFASINGDALLVKSRAPIGGGSSERLTVNNSGVYTSSQTFSELNFSGIGSLPLGEMVISRINIMPDETPNSFDACRAYYIINNYGLISNFTALNKVVLNKMGTIGANPHRYKLYHRLDNAEGSSWSALIDSASASVAGSDGELTFTLSNLNQSGQCVVMIEEDYVGLDDVTNHDVYLYPNPAKDEIKLIVDKTDAQLNYELIDESGKICKSAKIKDVETMIAVSNLAAGNYRIVVKQTDRILYSGQFVKVD